MTEAAEQRPVTALRGVGAALAERLARLGITRVQDLLFLLPTRYEDRTRIVPLGALTPGEHAVVEGEVQLTEVTYRRRRQLLCRISDGSGFLTLRFFYFTNAQQAALSRGLRLRCYGEVRRGPLGLEIVHPEYRRVTQEPEALEAALTPLYPATEGLTQPRLRMLIDQALGAPGTHFAVKDWLPAEVQRGLKLPPLREALELLHRPPRDQDHAQLLAGHHPAQRRLAFEELLAHQLSLRLRKLRTAADPGLPLKDPEDLAGRLLAVLPFTLTAAQQRVRQQIDADLTGHHPMLRLLQGDVGCGKTVVAALAAARAVGSGQQVALMAPTELLAEQHWRNLCGWFKALDVPVALLTGSMPARARKTAEAAIASGAIQIVVGTHALFQR